MRRSVVWMALTLVAPLPGLAQSWQPSVGLQGGFTYFQTAGGGSKAYFTDFSVPTFTVAAGEQNPPALYFVVPVHGRFALEPSLAVGVETGGVFGTVSYLAGLRGDYLLTRGLYVAGGFVAGRIGGAGVPSGFDFAAQAALGYRFHLAGPLQGRFEGVTQFWTGKRGAFPARDTYSLLFGVSAPFARSAVHTAPVAAAAAGPWRFDLGTSAGYAMYDIPDIANYASFTAPSWGGADFAYSLPSLFLTIPVGGRIALEPGLSVLRFHESDFTFFTATVSLHANYAFQGGWYAGVGGHVVPMEFTGKKLGALSGIGVQGGYRFHVAGPWDARIEVGHEIEARNRMLQRLPFSVTSVSVGVGVVL